jgi:hypothetical protein
VYRVPFQLLRQLALTNSLCILEPFQDERPIGVIQADNEKSTRRFLDNGLKRHSVAHLTAP